MDVNIFYPERGQHTDEARAVCAACPVTEQCQRHALDTGERHGVWGGKSIDRRRRLENSGRNPGDGTPGGQWKPVNHGTLGGYRQETRRGIPHCDLCLAARAEWKRQLRADGKAA
jgi:hypothetical protein